jgi:hypoxanthine phosphoribosyltransferase
VAISADKAWRILETAEQLCSAAEVSVAIERVGREITRALRDDNPLVLAVMRGSVFFAGQLLARLRFPLEFDYFEVTRYGAGTRGGEINWKVSPGTAIDGRTVLVIDDILDEGRTLAAIREHLLGAGAVRVLAAVLADKNIGRPKPASADFVGLTLPNRYVFGCGMDVSGAWRNLPEIYALKEGDA